MKKIYAVAKCATAEMFYGFDVIEIEVTSEQENTFCGVINGDKGTFTRSGVMAEFKIKFALFDNKNDANKLTDKNQQCKMIAEIINGGFEGADISILNDDDKNALVRIYHKLNDEA